MKQQKLVFGLFCFSKIFKFFSHVSYLLNEVKFRKFRGLGLFIVLISGLVGREETDGFFNCFVRTARRGPFLLFVH